MRSQNAAIPDVQYTPKIGRGSTLSWRIIRSNLLCENYQALIKISARRHLAVAGNEV